ncbi:PREDICTED: methylesterase 17-like [Ipomoea nil]|uniref:methylesterase 17-like n=1 Tax=Ipomoea nil TaxID=35883 RepID=UPI0009018832|nr:PREDICTED: methylesterase 17-like [Ipomoea nil]
MGEEVVEKQILEEKMIGKDELHFVLVHGIGGGAWCWYKLRCLLENSGGCKVTCLDLKASGIDPADANSVLSFDDYNKPLIDFLASLPHNQQVILVGHSAGGLSVTDASHKFPQKISLAIYVSATMLKTGFNSEQDIKDGVPDLSDFGEVFEVYDAVFGLGLTETPTSLLVKKEFQREIIYQMSPCEDSTLAAMLLRPGPIKALLNARFQEGEDDVERIPRIYIRSMHDNVVKPVQQDAMIKRWPAAAVYTLECDHSPFFSAPFMLSGLLLRAATSLGMLKY